MRHTRLVDDLVARCLVGDVGGDVSMSVLTGPTFVQKITFVIQYGDSQ